MIIIPLAVYSVVSLISFFLLGPLLRLRGVRWWEFLTYGVVYLSWLLGFSIRFSHKGFGNLLLEPMLIGLLPPLFLVAGLFAKGQLKVTIKIGLMVLSGAAVLGATWLAPTLGDWP
jgi:hypothetical protein